MMRTLRILLLFTGLLRAVSAPANEGLPEYDLKAQILVGFMPYVEWPMPAVPATGPFKIGVFGRSPFGSALDEYARTRTIQRRPIVIRYASKLDVLAGCDAIFICPSDADQADQVVEWARNRHVLTVADASTAADKGVMVVLLRERGYVHLVVNLAVAERQGLSFSSLLLRNARIIGPAPTQR